MSRHATLRRLEDGGPAPWGAWSALSALALGGSWIYGASLSRQLPWDPRGSALWLTVASGLGWCVLAPVLRLATGLRWRTLAHACLVTMACGELVLLAGAGMNTALRLAHPGPLNAGLVGLSNLAMAVALTVQLRAAGVTARRTLACWFLALDGGGAAFFLLLRHLL